MLKNLTPSQQFWSNKLLEAEQAGMSLAEFAREQDIPAQKLYQWRSTLKSKTQHVVEKTQFTRVVTNHSSSGVDLTLVLPEGKLQFHRLPDSQWLSDFLSTRGTSL